MTAALDGRGWTNVEATEVDPAQNCCARLSCSRRSYFHHRQNLNRSTNHDVSFKQGWQMMMGLSLRDFKSHLQCPSYMRNPNTKFYFVSRGFLNQKDAITLKGSKLGRQCVRCLCLVLPCDPPA